jgi:hypothetical protein
MTQHTRFLAYATANEGTNYLVDAANIQRWISLRAGLEPIHVCFAVSQVHRRNKFEERFFRKLADQLEQSGRFRVVDIIFKSNVGRDFSSWKACLSRFRSLADPDDFVLMLNRSAYGPLTKNWFYRYTVPFSERPGLGICGSSINQQFKTHVQSYAWMSRMGIMTELLKDFPGAKARTRSEAIFIGEIGTSQRIMAQGHSITSLAWPQEVFDSGRPNERTFPQFNIAPDLSDTPFRHWENSDYRHVKRFSLRARLLRLACRLDI